MIRGGFDCQNHCGLRSVSENDDDGQVFISWPPFIHLGAECGNPALTQPRSRSKKPDPNMKGSSLQLHDVSFRIGGRRILSGVNLDLRSGELTAVIGPSGSGKSTLIKCLSTTYRPSSGAVRFDGAELDTVRSAYRQRLGYVPQDDVIHRELRVETACRYAARLRLDAELSDTDIEERVCRVLETLGLGEHRRKRIRNLSGGQRKRVNIGVELLADPDVLLLDEPASGLDTGTEEDLVGCLKHLAGAGKISLGEQGSQ